MKLCPAQQEAFDNLLEAMDVGNICVVWSNGGMGRTTVLNELHRVRGGELLTMKDYIEDLRVQNPLAMEEVLERMLTGSLSRNDLVIMDDIDLIYKVICGCGYGDSYPRAKFVEAILTSIATSVCNSEKKLVISIDQQTPEPIRNRCYWASIRKFDQKDYEMICEAYLGKKTRNLDFSKIHRFAPKLNAHQLRSAAVWMNTSKELDTEKFIEYMRSQRMGSNVDLEEVEAIDIKSLRGIDDIIESLEANIIVPLERDDISTEFEITPKRGVLLAGPPGTGKTTIGRALAHRLRSKFFLIDGTYISGTRDFYQRVQRVFEAAKNNAPSIIFIDDSDVIFENKDDFGLYRYLLTMLDGLESKSNKRVCIMMTTMDVSSVPPALVRSGRIELWLETRHPDEKARLDILQDHMPKLPAQLRGFDAERLAAETDGLTGADLKRVTEDAKILFAFDRARNKSQDDIYCYFDKAVETIRSNKEKYEQAEAKAKAKVSMPNPFAFMNARFTPSDDDDDFPS